MPAAFNTDRLARMHTTLAAYVERGELPGLVTLLARRGEVHVDTIGAQALGGAAMRRDTIFRISSMSKPITAVAAMLLVEECRLRLDDPVDPLLPELAGRRVLQRIDAPLDETTPAERPISLRDLLTMRMGLGTILAPPRSYPIQRALDDLGLGDGPPRPAHTPPADEWLRRLGSLPLVHQPGERWMYNTSSDVLGVLVERAAGRPLEAFLRERIFEPLAMHDTGFSVPARSIDRLATSYAADTASGELQLYDAAAGGQWSSPPPFASGAGGLVSTADDYLAFCRMLLNKGKLGNTRILSRPAVELMTSDQVSARQRAGAEMFFRDSSSWGFGMAVYTRRDDIAAVPGRFGWDGGLGSSAYTDPTEDLIGILLTQSAWTSPAGPRLWSDFWTLAYSAIED